MNRKTGRNGKGQSCTKIHFFLATINICYHNANDNNISVQVSFFTINTQAHLTTKRDKKKTSNVRTWRQISWNTHVSSTFVYKFYKNVHTLISRLISNKGSYVLDLSLHLKHCTEIISGKIYKYRRKFVLIFFSCHVQPLT